MKKTLVVACSFAMASGGVSIYALHQWGKSRVAVTATVRDRDDLRTKLKAAEETVLAANARLAQARLHAESLKEDFGRVFPQKNASSATPSLPPAVTPMLSATTSATGRSLAPAPEN